MTHPTREELVELVYGETPGDRQATLTAHVQGCATCAAQLDEWRTAGRQMSSWKLPGRVRRHGRASVLPWAAAAAMITLAAAVGVLGLQVKGLRTQLARQESGSQAQLTELARSEAQAAVAGLEARFQEQRAADQRTYLAALQQLQTQQAQTYAGLRKELETVAVLTEAGLQQTQNQIANISSSPRNTPESSQQE